MGVKHEKNVLINYADVNKMMYGTEWGNITYNVWCRKMVDQIKAENPKCYVKFRQSKKMKKGKFYRECCVMEK